ncbi:hypothetical protein [Promicromonospora sp. NPDC090134]
MSDESQHEVTVRDNPDKSRFDVFVADTHAGNICGPCAELVPHRRSPQR